MWRRQAKGEGTEARLLGLRPGRRGCARVCGVAYRCDAQVCTWGGSNAGLKTILFAPLCQWVNRYLAEQGREWPWPALPCAPGPSLLCSESEAPSTGLGGQS